MVVGVYVLYTKSCWSAPEKGGRQKTRDDGNYLVHVKKNEWLRKNIHTMVSTIAHAQAFFIID